MSFFLDLFREIYGQLRQAPPPSYDPAVEHFELRSRYSPREGLGLITDLYNEVQSLDGQIEEQRQLSRSSQVGGIDREIARSRMRDLNAQRANRIGIARQIEKRIVPSAIEDHGDFVDKEESPRIDYIETHYIDKVFNSQMTLDDALNRIATIGIGLQPDEKQHILDHIQEYFGAQ